MRTLRASTESKAAETIALFINRISLSARSAHPPPPLADWTGSFTAGIGENDVATRADVARTLLQTALAYFPPRAWPTRISPKVKPGEPRHVQPAQP
jgi:acetate kinase